MGGLVISGEVPIGRNDQPADWLDLFRTYGVSVVILNARHDQQLVRLLQLEPGWAVDSVDGDTVLFSRIPTSKSIAVAA